jgi:PAS domain S-box-containing protein
VLLLDADGRHLRHGAAPSLPPEYIRAVDGLAVGPEAGSCGTAAFRRAPVFVEDIATDALWVAHKDLALPHGLRACWSTPIFDPEGSLLGCFAVYYRQPGLPPPEHQRVIEYGTQVASIAIFRKLSNEALLRSETKFRTLFDGAPDSVLLLDASGLLDCNETAVAVFGAGSRDNLLALHPSDFSPPCQPGGGASRMLADQRIAAALASGHQRFEWVHRRIDTGETFPAEVLLTALELDGNRILQAVVRDISERTRAEAATRAMAERLTLATDAAGIGTWDWDLRQNTWQCSPNYYAIMGQEPEEGIADRERWLASLHPEDRRAVVAQAEAVLAGRERSYEYEARILQADGSYRWAHVAGRAAEVDEDGRVLRMLGVRMDITARKLAEAELRENEDRFRDLVENSRELISTYDLEGNFLSVNRRTAELTGYSREALLTMNLSDLLDPGARHLFPEYLQTMRAEGRAKGIMKIRTVQGETRYWEYDTTLRTDGVAQPIIRGMGLDITEALHADRALRASETQLRVILESTDDGILAVGRGGRVLKANQRFAELWRVPPALLAEGQDQALLDHVLDQLADPGAFLEKVASLYESDATDLDLIRFKDGRCFERFSAPMWQGQTVTGRVWSFRDITQRKRAEQALAESLERFELANRATFNVIWDWDLVTHAFWRNDKFEILFGYKSEEVEPGVSTAFRLVHPDDMERVRAGIEAALASGAEFWTDTYRFSRKDGSFATVQDRALITRDEEGRAIRMLGAMQDISEQKAAEQALRESETKLRMIIEHSQQLFYTHTVDNAVTYVSPQVREFFETGPEDSYRPWTDFLTDNPVNALGLEISQRAIDTGKRQPPYQLEMRSAKGRKFWVEVHETPVVEGGRTVAMVGALTDITLSKRASDQLRLQGGALEAAANAIVITDREGLVEWANAAFTTMTGYPVAEAIGRTPGFLLKSGRQEEGFYKAMWDTLAAGEVWRGEIINKRRDGRHYPEDMTITPLRDERGAITHFVAIKQDITQRVEAEEELHRYTERLEALREIDAALLGARSTPELARGALVRLRHIVPFERAAVVLFDPELTKGTLIAVDQDQPWRPLAGESRPLGEFHDLGELRAAPFLNLQDLETARSCVLEQLLLSQGLRNLVYVPMEGEGALLGFVALSATTPGLLTPGHAEIAQDMTSQLAVALQHLRLKEELERANLRLESKVEERTAELQSTVATLQVLEGELRQREAEARAASEAKSTFLSSMSHELRTPLIGVTGMLEVLSQGDLNPQQRQVVDIIQESSESLLHIIGDILDFSKIEANKLELVPQAFSAQALVESVSHAFRSSISAKGLTCLVEVDPGIAPAHVADALRLRQILNNFMSNALKFTEQGSITLRLRKLGAGEGRETLAFEVADTGIGVSEENQKKLFAPFTQAEDSTTRRFGGTGLGLVISRRMAELMGGNLRMHSAVGQGTTMHLEVTVPIGDERNLVRALPEAAEAEPLRPAPSLEEAVRERSLVLLAEDHPTNRIVITQQVNRAGFALEVAVDGQEAFERWQSGRYALILTDLHMPRMDGVQLTQAVRERERERGLPRTPILALTANALGGEAARCLELGMDDYLIKPVNIALLASKLHQWLPHVAAAAGAPVPPADAAPDPDPEPGFDPALLLALCGGDGAAAKGILEEFLQATRDDLDELREALDRKDRPALARQAHRVKGSSAMVGARELAQRAAELEACARNDSADWSELQGRVAGMQEALAAIPRHS